MNPQIFTLQTWKILFNYLKLNLVERSKIISSYRCAWRPIALMWLQVGGRSVDDLLRGHDQNLRWAPTNREDQSHWWGQMLSTAALESSHKSLVYRAVCDLKLLRNIIFGGCVFAQINFGAKSSVTFSSDVFSRLCFVRLRFRSLRFVWLPNSPSMEAISSVH